MISHPAATTRLIESAAKSTACTHRRSGPPSLRAGAAVDALDRGFDGT
ncbi:MULTISPECIES: hypothetical protein [unclassified Streptomyces]